MRLEEYFKKYGVMKSIFAKKIGVSPTAIQNMLKGQIPRLDRALKIEEITDGAVSATLKDWVEDKRVNRKKNKNKNEK